MQNNNEQTIKISAVIPAYNAERYIGRAIESVLAQTRPVDEIIVIDDGSTDNTAGVVRAFGDKVKLILKENGGVSIARNAGITAATGNWIAFLDADDEWLPDKTALQVQLLSRNSHLVWISGNYLRCLCEEKMQRPHVTERTAMKLWGGKEYDNYFDAFLKDAWGCTDTMLVRKHVLLEVGMFQPACHQMEDMDLWWKIASRYPIFGYVHRPLGIYHLNVQGSLMQSRREFSACRKLIQKHLKESEKIGNADSVKACSVMMLKLWMRSMLFDRQADEIRKIMAQFNPLFSPAYKWMMHLLILQPALTARILRLISRIVRFLKLRQQLTRKPQKIDEQ